MSRTKQGLKRDPDGEAGKKKRVSGLFVIQEHFASHHHFDLRLEDGGVLRSWAIPKDPPISPGVKRLAIPTEDHPLDYAGFEGEIEEGRYGAGEVKNWDRGSFEIESRREDKLVLIMKGDRMRGAYVLLRFRPGDEKGKDMWLFFRRK